MNYLSSYRLTSLERFLVTLNVVATSFFVSVQSIESFRAPKELLFHFLVLGSIALHTVAWAARAWKPLDDTRRKVLWIIAVTLAWTTITTITSSNPILSRRALFHVALAAAFFWITLRTTSRGRERNVLSVALAVSVPNAAVAVLQRHGIWSPFSMEDLGGRLTVVGFLGNPNDLGGFLVPCALVHLAAALGFSGTIRRLHGSAFALACYAIAVTQSATALGSLVLGVAVLFVLAFRSNRLTWNAFGFLLLGALLLTLPLLALNQDHLRSKWRTAKNEGLEQLLGSSRLLPYTAAWIMARENPMLGTGPGTFSWQYLRAIRQARREFPSLRQFYPGGEGMPGEVHNDYLEILAETGVPGLVLACAALVGFAALHGMKRRMSRPPPNGPSPLGPWPLLASLMAQMAVNFPLQIPAVLMIYLYLGANVIAWQEPSESA